MSKPSIPEGTRDFGPEVLAKRNYIFSTIKTVFLKYGFQPIETPTMEKLATLTGKYGEEGDKLLFKILNNGDFLSKANVEALEDRNSNKLIHSICERGLRYDLTVPFARYVVMHRNDITFPFKRYQIQPVWRADRPQKGRYREFYQCDADVVGADTLMHEAELVKIYDEVFAELNLKVQIKVNNRKILEGVAEIAGISEQFMDMTIALDKLDKIGLDGVKRELAARGISEQAFEKIEEVLNCKTLAEIAPLFANSTIGQKGLAELSSFHAYLDPLGTVNELQFDITLARGLNYYTGCIFEVVAKDTPMGSIGGGGRYDNLTGVFGLPGVSGVGISFGADRIYDVLETLGLFPESASDQLQVLLIAFDEAAHLYAFQCAAKLRAVGISTDIYPEPAKIKKQMEYAHKRNVAYVIVIGDEEMATGKLSLKNMKTGVQEKLELQEVIKVLGA
jgi:histidyl-tRNA synthetase